MLNDRIKAIRESLGITQDSFASRVGVNKSTISRLESGVLSATSEPVLLNICRVFDVNYEWLKNGTGPMKNPPDTADELVDRIMTGEDGFAKSVMRAFAKLDDNEWKLLQKIVNAIQKEER